MKLFYEINSRFLYKSFYIRQRFNRLLYFVWLSKIDLKESFNLFKFKQNHFRNAII